jgi:F-type H+-transporting ATPase subunit gamma
VEQLPRLQARLTSLHELRDLIRALRAIAASRVQEAQGALAGMRRYVETTEDAIAQGAALLPRSDGHIALPVSPLAGVLIVVCSEHGFVGGFNERLLDRAAEVLAPKQSLVVIGRRGAVMAGERGMTVDRGFPMATHVGGVLGVTRRVAEHLATVSRAAIVFGEYRRGGNFEAVVRTILPLDPALLAASERRSPPLHHLAPEILLQRLASEYLFAEISRAVTESLASENGARLHVMEHADRNIGSKLDELRLKEHTLRQESITSELLDVVTGSEAVFASLAANRTAD